MPLLKNPTFCGYLAEAVRSAQKTHRFDVWAYVLMPEHLHLLIYPTQETYSISAILKSTKQGVSRKKLGWLRQLRREYLIRFRRLTQSYRAYRFAVISFNRQYSHSA